MLYIIERLLPDGEVVVGIDDTIERRWGARIKARGIYRDPVRSSKGHFVKTSGLRWLSLMSTGADTLGQADMGSAVPDDPGALGALEPAKPMAGATRR